MGRPTVSVTQGTTYGRGSHLDSRGIALDEFTHYKHHESLIHWPIYVSHQFLQLNYKSRFMSERMSSADAAQVAQNLLQNLSTVGPFPAPAPPPQSRNTGNPMSPGGSTTITSRSVPATRPASPNDPKPASRPAAAASAAGRDSRGDSTQASNITTMQPVEHKDPSPTNPREEPALPNEQRHMFLRRLLRALPIASDQQLQQVLNVFTSNIPPLVEQPGTPPRIPATGPHSPPPPPPQSYASAPRVPLIPPRPTPNPHLRHGQAVDPLGHIIPQPSSKRSGC